MVKPHDDDAPGPKDADGVDPVETPEDIDSMATMASGIHKRPKPTSSSEPIEPELPATFTGEGVDE
ncbi:MAG: hypothetical protein HOI89_00875, partial [Phycisphaerae bacterium]|nr:hypothetical protein [Phycisphaerae bacterium]